MCVGCVWDVCEHFEAVWWLHQNDMDMDDDHDISRLRSGVVPPSAVLLLFLPPSPRHLPLNVVSVGSVHYGTILHFLLSCIIRSFHSLLGNRHSQLVCVLCVWKNGIPDRDLRLPLRFSHSFPSHYVIVPTYERSHPLTFANRSEPTQLSASQLSSSSLEDPSSSL
jgi:hypothetical protein